MDQKEKLALATAAYHQQPAGKVATRLTKPCETQLDLSLAYTPGVGTVCQAIADQPELVNAYTNKGNTIAVVCDGTAVLGMGNIGAEAALPVIEGKGMLFKQFADIDFLPICIRQPKLDIDDPAYAKALATSIAALAPSVAGYNLEDIKAPQCFAVQTELEKLVSIPVFHDDQDGTAIILVAGLLNALKVVGKALSEVKIVLNGAGAAGIAICKLLEEFGVAREQLWLCDRQGLIIKDRNDLVPSKAEYAKSAAPADLAAVMEGSDVFIGVSTRDLVSEAMAASMAEDAIIFAVANPVPEIMPEVALRAGVRIVGTGRSDYPNQVNNSLGFPGLFRAVLDTQATEINSAMRIAATKALADLAQEPFPEAIATQLVAAYPDEAELGIFGRNNPVAEDYVIPKQFDLRVVPRVAYCVAKAALESGVAQNLDLDLEKYEQAVTERVAKLWQ